MTVSMSVVDLMLVDRHIAIFVSGEKGGNSGKLINRMRSKKKKEQTRVSLAHVLQVVNISYNDLYAFLFQVFDRLPFRGKGAFAGED